MKKKIGSLKAITVRICALAFGIWFVLMLLITQGGVTDVNNQLQREAWEYLLFDAKTTLNYSEKNAALPGYWQYCWAHITGWVRHDIVLELSFPFALKRFYGGLIPDDLDLGYEAAIIYWDKEGNRVKSGQLCYFPYQTQEEWYAGAEGNSGYATIDLSAFPEGQAMIKQIGTGPYDEWSMYTFSEIRFTGYFEEDVFCPVALDILSDWGRPTVTNGKTDAELDAEGKLKWDNIFTRQVETDRELVCIYVVDSLTGVNYAEKPVTMAGNRYDSLPDALDAWLEDNTTWNQLQLGLTDSVVMMRNGFENDAGEKTYVAIALRCNPLLYTVTALWPVYLVSAILAAVAVYFILRSIRMQLIEPVRQVNLAMAKQPKPGGAIYEPGWQEPYELEVRYEDLRQKLYEARTEVKQLQTALDYAKDAESYRRRMISGLTHELKTPLAVIHSYAEGLKEGIAKEKTEQYLDVILQESEWMDAMVLQMLDLSRLEAGKVRLSTDQFSLSALTQEVFDKMMPLAEEKELTVELNLVSDCVITADEGRIRQVVTNLASNAIKYTPVGGKIVVIAYRKRENNILCVENTCQRLSEEALHKVWDSFYRADAARSTEGTGLGLTIVKTIVELHGGNCQVFNTPTGVQFQIVLP